MVFPVNKQINLAFLSTFLQYMAFSDRNQGEDYDFSSIQVKDPYTCLPYN